MKRFLREMVELAGQGDHSHSAPVLELEFGDVLTRTTISTQDGVPCLSILALLPRSRRLNYLSEQAVPATGYVAGNMEFLWHADEGRYVLMRNIPVAEFDDEPSVMDAIMDTSDEAKSWFASVQAAAGC